MTAGYPKPSSLPSRSPYRTRPLFPIHPPPSVLTTPPPPLPSPPRRIPSSSPFTITTHIVPAAHIRSTPYVPLPSLPSDADKGDKLQRKKAGEGVRNVLNKIRDELASERPKEGYERVLWNCINRYVRKDRSPEGKGLTLFFAHANGFNKEIWEPTIHHLFTSSYKNIDEVWSFEAVQTGDSALLNTGKLGAIYDWTDNARDISNFLLYFLPTSSSDSHLPTHLPRVSHNETESRKKNGFAHRTLVAVGHSFGGCTSTLAALTYPKIFSSLILIDPVIVLPNYYQGTNDPYIQDLALGAILRRQTWKSREEAKTLMLKSPFFAAWDPSVLQSYIDYGTYAHPDGVSLKMPGVQEGIAFLENRTPYEVWERLKDVDERIGMHWIMPNPTTSNPAAAQERVWRREKNASNVIVSKAGHLIPQEVPRECAEEIVNYLVKKYPVEKSRL